LQLLLGLLAERDHRLLLIIQLQGIAGARVLDDSLDVLEVHQVGTVRFEEATACQAALQFLQGEVRYGLFCGGAQVGFAVAAGSVKDIARIIQ
jgi:hypothetical protein